MSIVSTDAGCAMSWSSENLPRQGRDLEVQLSVLLAISHMSQDLELEKTLHFLAPKF